MTGTGKIKYKKAYKSHLLTKKSTKRKRHMRIPGIVDSTNEQMVKRLLGLR